MKLHSPQSLFGFLPFRRMLLLGLIMFCGASLKAQHSGGKSHSSHDSESKLYRARYEVIYKQNRFDTQGKFKKHQDSLYLQSETDTFDSVVMKIARSKKGLLSSVGFGEGEESDKLFVNPYLLYDDEKESYIEGHNIYYYELENRQSIKIKFRNFSVKAITIPIKVRFGEDDLEFSANANLGAMAGYSWGTTKFTRRKIIGNTEIEKKNTLGVIFDVEELEFDFENENQQIIEETSSLISVGWGFVHSYQKFTVGLTGGFDFALGEHKTEWDYHARPWLGIAIGYSIFSF